MEQRSLELVTLAKSNPNDPLILLHALSSCSHKNYSHCDIQLLQQLLAKIDNNNSATKVFLMLDHINKEDPISALDALESIDSDDKYNDYFSEFASRLDAHYLSLNIANSYDKLLTDIFSMPLNSKGLLTCKSQIESSPQKERWQNACLKYAYTKMKSTTFVDRMIALSLATYVTAEIGPENEHNRLVHNQQQLQELLTEVNEIIVYLMTNKSEDYYIWVNDIKTHGEIAAAERLVAHWRDRD